MTKKAWIKLTILLVSVLLVVILIIQNTGNVELRILFFPAIRLPQALLLALVFLLGFIAGIVATFRIGLKDKKEKV
jgi:uncharacterized integral membrane protein